MGYSSSSDLMFNGVNDGVLDHSTIKVLALLL
jgi:hypothetical protein